MKKKPDHKEKSPNALASDKARRRTQAERRDASMAHILDNAEELFAQLGYNGVTLNDVARHANIDTALMRYYFGDKKQLFHAVFTRRAAIINEIRMKALEEYEASFGDAMTVEGAIDAFIRSAFELMAQDEGWRNYGAIVAYVNSSRGPLRQLMSDSFDPVSIKLIAMLKRILPDAPDREIYWGYHFLTGAFTFSLGQTGRIDALSDGLCSSSDFQAIAERLSSALAASIVHLAEAKKV